MEDGRTGLLFHAQTVESLAECIEKFEAEGVTCSKEEIRAHSLSFSEARFEEELRAYCDRRVRDWRRELRDCAHQPKEETD